MPTTSNFGWTTPADTDLVKDGALAIRTLGNGVDTSMAQLKGGTTGQVLSKTSNTDMAFTWVTQDDANAIQNTIVDAKGDLITATGNDVPARLAVGNNGDTLVADSAATTGLRYIPATVMANPVINGGFDIWQRGTSISLAASTSFTNSFGADRWQSPTNTNQAATVTRQSISDSTNLPNIQYCGRYQRNSGQTGTGQWNIGMTMETSNSIPFAGKTITFSFYARAGANYSAASSALGVNMVYGTGTDQTIYSGLTNQTSIIGTNATLTTTWQRFTYTASVASVATQLGFYFAFTPTGTAGANDWFEVTGVQIDVGNVALPFRRSGGTIQGELAACQRYYYRNATANGSAYQATAIANGTTQAFCLVQLPVTMRTSPTAVDYANLTLTLPGTADYAFTGLTVEAARSSQQIMSLKATGLTGLTDARPYFLVNSAANGYVGFSAEL